MRVTMKDILQNKLIRYKKITEINIIRILNFFFNAIQFTYGNV